MFHRLCFHIAGDMEFKQNKFLPAEKQIVTANPDINTVCINICGLIKDSYLPYRCDCFHFQHFVFEMVGLGFTLLKHFTFS